MDLVIGGSRQNGQRLFDAVTPMSPAGDAGQGFGDRNLRSHGSPTPMHASLAAEVQSNVV